MKKLAEELFFLLEDGKFEFSEKNYDGLVEIQTSLNKRLEVVLLDVETYSEESC